MAGVLAWVEVCVFWVMESDRQDTDVLLPHWSDVNLGVEEVPGLDLHGHGTDDDEFDLRWCLVGRLLSDKKVDFEAFRQVMAALWRPVKGLFIKEVEINRYVFQFFHELDIGRVLDGSPWTFHKIPLILERLQIGEDPRLLKLDSLAMWVRVRDLRAGCLSEKVLRACGNFIGSFLSVCPTNFTGIWKDYLRVRVLLNVTQPLKRRMMIIAPSGEKFWANFQYEQLPLFCFLCGILGHSEQFCHQYFAETTDNIPRPYGLFMRAPDKRGPKQIGAQWLRDGMARPWIENSSIGSISPSSSMRNSGQELGTAVPDEESLALVRKFKGQTHRFSNRSPIPPTSMVNFSGPLFAESGAPGGVGVDLEAPSQSYFVDLKRRRVNLANPVPTLPLEGMSPSVDQGMEVDQMGLQSSTSDQMMPISPTDLAADQFHAKESTIPLRSRSMEH